MWVKHIRIIKKACHDNGVSNYIIKAHGFWKVKIRGTIWKI